MSETLTTTIQKTIDSVSDRLKADPDNLTAASVWHSLGMLARDEGNAQRLIGELIGVTNNELPLIRVLALMAVLKIIRLRGPAPGIPREIFDGMWEASEAFSDAIVQDYSEKLAKLAKRA